MLRTTAIALVLAACGNGGPTHWKDQPTVTFTGIADGHAFSFEGPKGMVASKVDPSEYTYNQKVDGEDYVFAPRINIHFSTYKQTLDDALKSEKDPPLHKAVQPDGWMYSMENPYSKGKNNYIVRTEKDVADGAFTCNAQVYPMTRDGDENVKDKLLPLVEKMCASLKVK